MKFLEVAHLYVGCKVMWGNLPVKLVPTRLYATDVHGYKPILFPLSAMTEEQEIEMLALDELNHGWRHDIKVNAIRTHYLLSQHFDLFNLISQGEAIDVTTLEVNPYTI